MFKNEGEGMSSDEDKVLYLIFPISIYYYIHSAINKNLGITKIQKSTGYCIDIDNFETPSNNNKNVQ